jgi:hypothetical protein
MVEDFQSESDKGVQRLWAVLHFKVNKSTRSGSLTAPFAVGRQVLYRESARYPSTIRTTFP